MWQVDYLASDYSDFRAVKSGLAVIGQTRLETWDDADMDAWELAYERWEASYVAEVGTHS